MPKRQRTETFESSPAIRKELGLKKLSSLMTELRTIEALREVKPGIFQWRSRPFLHFHYVPDGALAADVRLGSDSWQKFDVTNEAGRARLIAAIRQAVAET